VERHLEAADALRLTDAVGCHHQALLVPRPRLEEGGVLLVKLPPQGASVWVITEQTALALTALELLKAEDEFGFFFWAEFFHGLRATFA
jgi:hypothetical protein